MELKKVQETTFAKTIFATLAISSLTQINLIFPSANYLYSEFAKDKKQKLYVRKVLRRLEKQDLISIKKDSDGKFTITITNSGKQKALAYELDTMELNKPAKWDQTWRIVIFDIPEAKRKVRDYFRHYLNRLGFYKLQKSVFISPYPCKDEIDLLKENFEISENITFIEANNIDNQDILKKHFNL